MWLADDRDGEVVGFGLSHDELRSRTTELADERGSEGPRSGARFRDARGPSAVPQLVSERAVDARMPEPVAQRLELGGRHPLIGLGELA